MMDGFRQRVSNRLHRSRLQAERIADLEQRLAYWNRDDRLDYLFVATYGRSGSTLVQGILNSIPGYLIRGENRQALRHLYSFDRLASKERQVQRRKQRSRGAKPGSSDTTSPLFGMDNYPHAAAVRMTRKLAVRTLLRPPPGTRVTGFKEIEWGEPDTLDYVRWLREVFPGARFVVNTRDLDAVAHSAWWGHDQDAADELRRREELLMALLAELGNAAFHIRYDDFTADPATLAPLFEWLGEPFDLERVSEVLGVRHSFRPKREREHPDQTDEEPAAER
jgi:hypothetical protein